MKYTQVLQGHHRGRKGLDCQFDQLLSNDESIEKQSLLLHAYSRIELTHWVYSSVSLFARITDARLICTKSGMVQVRVLHFSC
jgi:hypothetical protein